MWMYDLTGGLRIRKLHQRISKDDALAHMPTLRRGEPRRGYLYYDAQTDDARLTLTIARTAAAHGAVVANHASVAGPAQGRRGARPRRTGRRRRHRDRGPRRMRRERRRRVGRRRARARRRRAPELDPPGQGRPRHGARGRRSATTSPRSSRCREDRRSVFVVPWGDFTYVGTTDTDYDGPLDDPQCDPSDIAYLLDALNGVLRRAGDRRTTSSARGPGCARCSRSAKQRRGPPTSRAATACARPRAASSRSPAAS